MSYFIKRNEKVNGPFTSSQVKSGLKSGKLNDMDLISKSEEGPWKPLGEVIAKGNTDSQESPVQEPEHFNTITPEPEEVSAPFTPVAETPQAKSSKSGKTHPIAIVSLVLGILSWTVGCCCYLHIPLGLAAAITGVIGIIFANKGRGGKGMAVAGLVLGVLALVVLTLLVVFGFAFSSWAQMQELEL